jgi:hypothetical protein
VRFCARFSFDSIRATSVALGFSVLSTSPRSLCLCGERDPSTSSG